MYLFLLLFSAATAAAASSSLCHSLELSSVFSCFLSCLLFSTLPPVHPDLPPTSAARSHSYSHFSYSLALARSLTPAAFFPHHLLPFVLLLFVSYVYLRCHKEQEYAGENDDATNIECYHILYV